MHKQLDRLLTRTTRLRVLLGLGILAVISFDVVAQTEKPELVVQTGAEGVYGMALTSDGKTLATAGLGSTLKIWDAVRGRELRSIGTASDWTLSVAFSPSGKLLANTSSGNGQSFIELWEVASGRKIVTFTRHTDRVTAVAFAHNGEYVVSGSIDKTIRIWDVHNGREVRTLNQSRDVWSVAVSPDGRIVAGGDTENKIQLWDFEKGKKLHTLEARLPANPVCTICFVASVAFSPDGRWLASGSTDATIRIWDVGKGKLVRTIQGHSKSVNSVSFSPNGKTLASGSYDTFVKLWDVDSGRELRTFSGDPTSVHSIVFSPDGLRLFSAGEGSIIKAWSTENGSEVLNIQRYADAFASVAFSPDGKKILSGGGTSRLDKSLSNRETKLWSASGGKEFRTLRGQTDVVTSVAVSPDGRSLASAGWDQMIRLWNAESGAEVRKLIGHKNTINVVAFSPDGRLIASASGGPIRDGRKIMAGAFDDNTIRLWDTQTGREIRRIEAHPLPIFALAFSRDGKRLASAANYGAAEAAGKKLEPNLENLRELSKIKIWDVDSGAEVSTLGHADFYQPITTLTFSPNGKLLACGGYDKQITLWDLSSRSRINTLRGHSGSVDAVAFSPDGFFIASGSQDRTIKIWNAQTGQETRTLTGHKGLVRSLSFNPTGKILVSTGPDSSTKLWDVTTGKELASLFAIADEDWLIVTPDGLFDGSPSAWNKILWRFAGSTFDVLPVEAFFSDFYYPGLFGEILEGKRPVAKTNLQQVDRQQPKLALSLLASETATVSTTARNATVKLDVISGPGGVRDVRLFRNGSLVRVWHGDLVMQEGKVTLQATIPIVAGENHLTAYAFNHDNIKSEDATLTVQGAETLSRKGTVHVLTVGIDGYANPQYNLKYAVADAKDFGEEFREQQLKLAHFSNVQLIPLFDKDATKANILLALKRLAGSDNALPIAAPPILKTIHPAQPEDAVIVYFAGHGTAQQNQFFLVPYDLGYQGSRTQLDRAALDTILRRSISDRELEQAFEQVDAGQIVFIIDACNSGQALEAEEKRRGPMNSKGLAQLAYEKGMYILTAAQSYQAALETPQHGHGYLTYALVGEGLKTANADVDPSDELVTVREWLDYATQRVPQLQEEDARRPKQSSATTQQQMTRRKAPMRPQRGRQGNRRSQQGAETTRQFERDKPQVSGPGTSEEKFLQQPRVFYRREIESAPLIVSKAARP